MARLLIVVAILVFAVKTFMPGGGSPGDPGPAATLAAVREVVADTSPRFQARLQAGAGCAELIALRDIYDPASAQVGRMNDDLRGIGCDAAGSTRTR